MLKKNTYVYVGVCSSYEYVGVWSLYASSYVCDVDIWCSYVCVSNSYMCVLMFRVGLYLICGCMLITGDRMSHYVDVSISSVCVC